MIFICTYHIGYYLICVRSGTRCGVMYINPTYKLQIYLFFAHDLSPLFAGLKYNYMYDKLWRHKCTDILTVDVIMSLSTVNFIL